MTQCINPKSDAAGLCGRMAHSIDQRLDHDIVGGHLDGSWQGRELLWDVFKNGESIELRILCDLLT